MIRFLQSPGRLKKYVLSGILLVICVSMVWYLVPSGSSLGLGEPGAGTVATVSGESISTTEVRQQAERLVQQHMSDRMLQWQKIEAMRLLAASPNTKVIMLGDGKSSTTVDVK